MFYKLVAIKNFFRYDIPHGIRNLIEWFPIVWKDRNWDYSFIYLMLRHKLHLTEQLIRNHGIHIHHIKDADSIRKCVLLLDRLIADEYFENVMKPHDKKWGESKLTWHSLEDGSEMSELTLEYPNVKTLKDKKQQRKDFNHLLKIEQNTKQQDIDMVFNIMKKKIQSWWD